MDTIKKFSHGLEALLAAVGTGMLLAIFNASPVSFISVTEAQVICSSTRAISAARWSMVGISCKNNGVDSIESVFGDDFAIENYASIWVLYQFQAQSGDYVALPVDAVLKSGEGYWLYSLANGQMTENGASVPVSPKSSTPECASDAGCFEIDLDEPGSGETSRWNMLSQPLNMGTNWQDVCITDGTTSYSPSQADVLRLMSKNIYKYNGNAYATFDDVTPGLLGTLMPNEGFWIELLESAVGKDLKLLIPAGVTTDPCGNLPPSLALIQDQGAQINTSFSVQASATDPDPNDILDYSLPTAPGGMGINSSTGLIQWTPSNAQLGANPVTVRASDPLGLFDEENFQVNVRNTNNPPDLIPVGDRSIRAGIAFDTPLFAVDPDPGDTLTFSLLQAPQGMTLGAQTGILSWTPTTQNLGQVEVTAMVQDSGGLIDTEPFMVIVFLPAQQRQDNAPPILTVPDDQSLIVDSPLNVQASATDPDAGDILIFDFIRAPGGMNIDANSGAISWTPTSTDIGAHDVTVRVTDQNGAIDSSNFVVTVKAENRAPVAIDKAYSVNFEQLLSVPAAGVLDNDSDPDGDSITAIPVTFPKKGSLDFNADGSFNYRSNVLGNQYGEDINLVVEGLPVVSASSSFSTIYDAQRAIDGDLDTSWFTARPDPFSPNAYIDLQFESGITVKELQLWGNRAFPTGFDFLSGKFELFDDTDTLIFDSGDLNLPDNGGTEPNRDLVFPVIPPVENVLRVRFTSSAIENSVFEAGLAEFRVIGDGLIRKFSAVKQWSWEGGIDDNGVTITGITETVPSVIDLNGDQIPEVIFNVSSGHLLALNGVDGTPLFIVGGSGDPDRQVAQWASLAVGDIDGDGKPEIVIPGANSFYIKAFEDDGSLKWTSERLPYSVSLGGTAIADLDGDGSPEIIPSSSIKNRGVAVLNADGSLRFSTATNGSGNNNYSGGLALISDIDLDGSPDIIAGNTVYNADGSTKWYRDDLTDGYNAVGNFDEDAYAEIVLVTNGNVLILEHDGSTKFSTTLINVSGGGAPTVADFDGDGKPEIGVAGSSNYHVFEHDLTLKWAAATVDSSSARTGSTVFDFENDGIAEVVYSDEQRLWVYRGTDGKVLLNIEARSTTGVEAPIVADVDKDGSAEIVAMASVNGTTQPPALFILKAGDTNWATTRPIWNQHTYHVTNINLDGSIPAYEQPNWLTPGLNNFRQNQFLPDEADQSVDSFTYKANDGVLDSNVATVYIDMLPVNTAPQFVSVPLTKATAGFEYLYGSQAIDQESDAISFALVNGPVGMSIDPAIGLVRWSPTLGELGEHEITLNVTDSKGFSSLQAYTILVVFPLEVPDVIGDTLPVAASEITLVTLAMGRISEQIHPQVPEGLVIGQSPAAGTLAQMGDKVDLVFSLGRGDTSDDGNQPPLAVDDSYQATVGVQLSVLAPGVKTNDRDPDGDAISASIIDLPTQGTATLQSNGAFTYLYDPAPPVPGDIEVEPFSCTRDAMDAVKGVTGQVAVGDVDNDGDLEIVGIHFSPGARLFILNAETCAYEYDQADDTISAAMLLSVPEGRTHIGLVNLDGDDDLEIVLRPSGTSSIPVQPRDINGHLVALNIDGSFVWNRVVDPGEDTRLGNITPLIRNPALPATAPLQSWSNTGPTFADLDGDGEVEIIMGFYHSGGGHNPGVVAFNGADGSVKWVYFGSPFFNGTVAYMPHVADIDLDGTPEVIYDRFILDHNGNLELELQVNDGSTTKGVASAIANFDDDAFAEILVRYKQYFYLFEHDGTLKWKKKFTESTLVDDSIGTLTVGDFDGDGEMEFTHRMRDGSAAIFGNNSRYQVVYDTDGSILWSHLGQEDYHSEATGRPQAVVAFDVNQDGADDIVASLRIDSLSGDIDLGPGLGVLYAFDGKDGSELFRARAVTSTAGNTFPVIADLDNDGAAEIITGGTNNLLHVPSTENFFIHRGKSTSPLSPAPPLHTQWTFNPAYVSLDASIPANPNPHWLIPGLNGFHKVPTVRDVQEPPGIQDSFSYVINDGTAFSNTATVNLKVSPSMSPPEIVSEPVVFATENLLYQYVVFAVDPDAADTLSYVLTLAPSGMTIDPLTGVVQWLPGSGDVGDHAVRAIAQDSDGLADIQDFTITVAAPTLVPDVLDKTTLNAQADIHTASLLTGNLVDIFNKDVLPGSVVEQAPLPGTQVANGSKVHLFISKGPGPLDSDDDGDGQSENEGDCNDSDDTIFSGATDLVGDGIDQNCDGVDGNFANAQIIVEPDAPTLLTGQSIVLKAIAVFPDQTSIDISSIGTWSSGNAAIVQVGSTGIVIAAGAGSTAVQLSHAGLSGSTIVTVVATDIGDLTPPTAQITSPERNSTITAPVEIIGTASDASFLKYTLEIAPVGESNFTEIARSTTAVTAGVLGQFDPTLLLNDLYTVRLTVVDQGGNFQIAETVYQVDENMKVGNFSLTFTDLQIPMSGIPITVNRTYDSRDKRMGDFGVGWRLDVQTLQLRTNRVMGTGWSVIKSGYNFVLQAQDQHKVSLTLPGGRVEEFDMVVSPMSSVFVPFPPFANRASFKARPGTLGKLQSLDNNNLSIFGAQPGEVFLVDDITNRDYDPQRFKYTSSDGTEIVISKSSGVEKITEANGNTLEFRADGIFHSAGKQALFERDNEGRIVKLIDPNGNEQLYTYDMNGDLESYTDKAGFMSRFAYNREHGLLSILDPLNRVIARNEYDNDGRLTSSTNSDGRRIEFGHDLNLRQEIMTDTNGSITVLEYDLAGNIIKTTNPLGGITTSTYDGAGNQLSTTDAEGKTIVRTFDSRNNQLTETDPLGNTTTFTFNLQDNVTSVMDPLGRQTSFIYDSAGNRTTKVDALGNVESIAYDNAGNVLAIEDELGNSIQYGYDSSGNQVFEIDALGNRQNMSYDDNGDLLSRTNRRGFSKINTLNTRGLTVSSSDYLGIVSSFNYDAIANLESIVDGLGATITIESDISGREIVRIDALGNRFERSYDIKGNLAETINPDGFVSAFEYDAMDFLTQRIDALGNIEKVDFDQIGQIVRQIDQRGNITQIEYDSRGRRTKITNSLGIPVTFEYDAVGNLVRQIDAKGNFTQFSYDSLNRRTRTDYPDSTFEKIDYNAIGQVISKTDALGLVVTLEYDANGNLSKLTDPSGAETTFVYDSEDNLISRTDTNGNTTTFTYDANNRQLSKTYPDGSRETREFDDIGNIVARTDSNGNTTRYEYDAGQRLVSKINSDGGSFLYSYSSDSTLATLTDARGITSYSFDALTRLAETINPDGSSLNYTYDGKGNLTSTTSKASSSAVPLVTAYNYDSLNRLNEITDSDGEITQYFYDANNNLNRIDFPNGTSTIYQYDVRNQPVQIEFRNVSNTFDVISYTLNSIGNRIRADHLDGSFIEYQYDILRRLTREIQHDTTGMVTLDMAYTYDPVGNRLSQTDNLNSEVKNFVYDNADKLLNINSTFFSYDANGSLISRTNGSEITSYKYNANNQLTQVSSNSNVFYNYDGFGNRVRKSSTTGVTNYLVDSNNNTGYSQTASEYDDTGSIIKSYTFGDDLVRQTSPGETGYYHYDALNSTRLISNTSGNVSGTFQYDAFGNTVTSNGSALSNYLFTGEQFDSSSDLYYMRSRYYAPGQGRFLSRDPFNGNNISPASLHKYIYANANPVNFIDPSGEVSIASVLVTTGIIGGLAGAIMVSTSEIKSSVKEFSGRTDQFRLKVCQGGVLGDGFGGVWTEVIIAEQRSKDINNPRSARYSVGGTGLVFAIGALGSGEIEFEAPGLRGLRDFKGTGRIIGAGASIGVGTVAAGLLGEIHYLPEGSEVVTNYGSAKGVGTQGLAAYLVETFWSLTNVNSSLGFDGNLDCHHTPSKSKK